MKLKRFTDIVSLDIEITLTNILHFLKYLLHFKLYKL